MSLLPQRKKSADEIAQLRDALGVVPPPPSYTEPFIPPPPIHYESAIPAPVIEPEPEIISPAPSLPRPQVEHVPRVVRSLRKSEQGPLRPIQARQPIASVLPDHRHDAQEIQRLHIQETLAHGPLPPNPLTLSAHFAIVIPGYLAALCGGIWYFHDGWKLWETSLGVVAALAIAAFIFIKKPYSRHHAAFITVIAVLVLIFSILHYFPNIDPAHAP